MEELAARENQHFFKTVRKAAKSLREAPMRITTRAMLRQLPYFGDHTSRVSGERDRWVPPFACLHLLGAAGSPLLACSKACMGLLRNAGCPPTKLTAEEQQTLADMEAAKQEDACTSMYSMHSMYG